MGGIHFTSARGEEVSLHIQCPFRFVGGEHVLLGSADMKYPQRDAGPDAYDSYRTVYDAQAGVFNDEVIPALSTAEVSAVDVAADGFLTLTWPDDLRLQVFPACSGPVEAWRVFDRFDYYGYPFTVEI